MRKKIWLIMVGIVILTLMSASIAEAGMFDWITGAPAAVQIGERSIGDMENAEIAQVDPISEESGDNTGGRNFGDAEVALNNPLGNTDGGKDVGMGMPTVATGEVEQCDCCLCFTSTLTGTKGEGFSTTYELRSDEQLNSGVYLEYCGGCRENGGYTDTAFTCESQLVEKEETCVVDCCNCWSEETGFDLATCENPIESLECREHLGESESYFNDMCGEPTEDKPQKEEFDCCECVGEDGEMDLHNCPDFDGKQQEYCLQWGEAHSNYFGKGVCYEEDDPTEEPPQLSPWECENRKDDDGDGKIDFKGGCDIDGDKVIDLIAQECGTAEAGKYYLPDDCCTSFKDDSETGYYVTYGVGCSDGKDNDGDGRIDFAGACKVDETTSYKCDNRQQTPSTSSTDCYLPELQKTCEEIEGNFIRPDSNCISPFFSEDELSSITPAEGDAESTESMLIRAPSQEDFAEDEGFFTRLGKILTGNF